MHLPNIDESDLQIRIYLLNHSLHPQQIVYHVLESSYELDKIAKWSGLGFYGFVFWFVFVF